MYPEFKLSVISSSSLAASRHAHLDQGLLDLRGRELQVRQIGLADGLANHTGGLGHGDVTLAEQFTRLFAAESKLQKSLGGAAPMSRVAISANGRSPRSGPPIMPNVWINPICGSRFSMK